MGNDSDSTNPAGNPAGPSPLEQDRIAELLKQGQAAAQNGRHAEARRLFRAILALDRINEDAWIWLAYLAPSPRQSVAYVEQARNFHPESQRVTEAMDWAQKRIAEAESASGSARPNWPGTEAPAAEPAPQATPKPAAKAQSGKRPVRTMARPQDAVQARPRRRALLIAPLILLILALAVAGAYLLWWQQATPPAPVVEPTPAPTATPSMAALRELANAAIVREDWEQAILQLEDMRRLSPDDDGVRQQLAVVHLRLGLQLVGQDHIDEAIAHYDAAIRFYANDMDLQTARRLAISYRDGRKAVQDERWDEAIDLLESTYKLAPDLLNTRELLFQAHVQRAAACESTQKLMAARDEYARALEIKPNVPEVRTKLNEIIRILTPPTPTPTPRPAKRVVINISQQRLRAYQNDNLVFDWVCSTGEPARPTQPGSYQVLDKIPEAWSSVWGLRMPYWLGIYWAGASENGIHALPINKNGQTLWAGYLGHKVSFGCVILDTPNAAKLYQWVEIGTPVIIVP